MYKKSQEQIAALSPESFHVTQKNGTERPGTGALLHNKEPGIYVDIVSGEPLFISSAKYDSGSGWPSFTSAIEDNIIEISDSSLGMQRVEVRSKYADSHLGHVFPDGPSEAGGMRYCINSASLRFIALTQMEQEGYSDWISLVKTAHQSQESKDA